MTGVHILDFFVRGRFAAPVNHEAEQLLLAYIAQDNPTLNILHDLIWINLWWGLVNLLPVFPLDGGQIAIEVSSSRKRVHEIGIVIGAAFALVGLVFLKSVFIAILFGLLAFQNYQYLQKHNF